jgi:hypothetical protein
MHWENLGLLFIMDFPVSRENLGLLRAHSWLLESRAEKFAVPASQPKLFLLHQCWRHVSMARFPHFDILANVKFR